MRLRRASLAWVLPALLLATVLVGRASGQPAPRDEYLALIDAYAGGDTRAALVALAEHDDRWTEAAVAASERAAAAWPAARVRAAALLHTEVVTGGWVLPVHVPVHLSAARRYVEGRRGGGLPDTFRRGWLLAVCWHYQSELELGALVPWLDELRTRFPDWSETALASGVFYEVLGWTEPLPADLAWSSGSRLLRPLSRHTQREALELAVAELRRAGASPDTAVQATVRLGRVLGELGRADEARAVLAPMRSTPPDRRWRYLAVLFTARAEGRAGRTPAELGAYEEAARIMPGCQTPLVGIAAAQRRLGNTLLAVDTADALTRGSHICDDPWWGYRFGQPADRLPELLRTLRGDRQ